MLRAQTWLRPPAAHFCIEVSAAHVALLMQTFCCQLWAPTVIMYRAHVHLFNKPYDRTSLSQTYAARPDMVITCAGALAWTLQILQQQGHAGD